MNEDDFTIFRDQLADEIRAKGIEDENVIAAIRKVSRHRFIPKNVYTPQLMYADQPLEIGEGQTISQPFTVAFQSQLLDVKRGEKILEVGTGSGYQAAVLAELGAEVYTIERIEKLYLRTNDLLNKLGYKTIHTFLGDGNLGIPFYAPFDKIIITAAASELPEELIKQLRIGGKMVVPVNGTIQQMQRITKVTEEEITRENFGQFYFVPMLGGVVMGEK